MSTAKDRLFEVYETYRIARSKRAADWKDAKTMAQADRIRKNVQDLELTYLKAALASLTATGKDVEDAMGAAKAARKDVQSAYKSAKALSERIRSVSAAAKAMSNLVKKAVA